MSNAIHFSPEPQALCPSPSLPQALGLDAEEPLKLHHRAPPNSFLWGVCLVKQKGLLATQELKWQRDWRGLAWQADREEATRVGWGGWERGGAASEEDEREQPGGRRRGGGAGRRGPALLSADARRSGSAGPGRQPPAAAHRIGDTAIPLTSSQARHRDHSQDKCRLGKAPCKLPGPGWRRAAEGASNIPSREASDRHRTAPTR